MNPLHPYALYRVGDLFVSTQDETDQDHTGRERTTPAGSIWRVTHIERHKRGAAYALCAYHMHAPASGAAIVVYSPIPGVPYDHPRDEMAAFLPLNLPDQCWLTLRLQLCALREIADALHEMEDERAGQDPNEIDLHGLDEFANAVRNQLRMSGIRWAGIDAPSTPPPSPEFSPGHIPIGMLPDPAPANPSNPKDSTP